VLPRLLTGVLLVVLWASRGSANSSVPRQTILSIEDSIQSGNLESAEQQVQAALGLYGSDPGLLNLRGVIYARRGDVAKARLDFAQAVSSDPSLLPAWRNLARACALVAEQDKSAINCAINGWKYVEQLIPQDVEAHSALAFLYQKTGFPSQSLKELAALPPAQATLTGNLEVRCIDLCSLGRIAEAKAAGTELGARTDFSDSDLASVHGPIDTPKCASVLAALIEQVDARHEASLASLQRLALAQEALGQIGPARQTLERVAVQDSTNTAHLFELARLAELTKDHEGALGYLAHARELAPNNPRVHFLFGLIAAEMDLFVEARRSLDRALAIEPENPDYNYAMGSVILKTREPAASIPYFEKALRVKPADVHMQYALGVGYFASGEYEKARERMQALETDAKAAAGAEYFLGRIARLDAKDDEAAEHLRKSIRLMPGAAEPHTELARVFVQQGRFDAANAEITRALALDASSFQANEELLVLYKRTHDPRESRQAEVLKRLDEERSRRAELMLRTVEVRPE
jgi:tetratricopeptide (TPR) repeat protein